MGRVFSSRRTSSRPDIAARADILHAGADILTGWAMDIRRDERIKQLSNANIGMIREWGLAEKNLIENANDPDVTLKYWDDGYETRKAAVSEGITDSETMKKFNTQYDEAHAKYRARLDNLVSAQKQKNIVTDHGVAVSALGETIDFHVEDDGMPILMNRFDDIEKTIGGGLKQNLYTEKEAESEIWRLKEIQYKAFTEQENKHLSQEEAHKNIDSMNAEMKANGYKGDMFDPDEIAKMKKDYDTAVSSTNRVAKENLAIAQEKTGRELLSNIWDNKITDPQVITDAYRNNLITDSMAKYARSAIADPKDHTSQEILIAEKEVRDAIDKYQSSDITDVNTIEKLKQEAIETLYANAAILGKTKGSTLLAKLYDEVPDKKLADMTREGKGLMEEYIRTKDMFGAFEDNKQEIMLTAEAQLLLDLEIEEAKATDKPLGRRDIMIKALEIGQQQRNKLDKMEEGEVPKVPYKLGKLEKPLFQGGRGGKFKGYGASGTWDINKKPDQATFLQVITNLKKAGKTDEARVYYDKWVGELWQ